MPDARRGRVGSTCGIAYLCFAPKSGLETEEASSCSSRRGQGAPGSDIEDGNPILRTLVIPRGTTVLVESLQMVAAILSRLPLNVAAMALANKMARVLCAPSSRVNQIIVSRGPTTRKLEQSAPEFRLRQGQDVQEQRREPRDITLGSYRPPRPMCLRASRYELPLTSGSSSR